MLQNVRHKQQRCGAMATERSRSMETRDHSNGVSPKNHRSRGNFLRGFMFMKAPMFLLTTFIAASKALAQPWSNRSYYGRDESFVEYLGPISWIVVGLMVTIVVIRIIRNVLRKGKNVSNTTSTVMTPPYMGMRGKTAEQKKVVKYFMSTGILGMIFRISNSTFDNLLNSKADELVSGIEGRALETHGMDADEVKEIPPILAEGYYEGSQYFKVFRNTFHTSESQFRSSEYQFRASEYQMTYLMFSDKQMYAYSYIFDLTSANTSEQTKEYFYEDITSVEVTKKQIEFPTPRPMEYLVGGIAGIILGLLLMVLSTGNGGVVFLGLLILVFGIIIAFFAGYSRHIVEKLFLRLTVAGDEFVCAMKPENMEAIQGMKAKIRDKKG